MREPRAITITADKTLMPIGLAVVIMAAALGATWWLAINAATVTTHSSDIAALHQANTETAQELKNINMTLTKILTVLDERQKP